ncbi:DNA-binding protein [Floridanema aerugineum]|jgi:DNA-binding phage protein|uniref:DNA-binding protein n=1 Tax=Floridaenema aerugineum BLCC-F46 TaxID=3153654 RepID=A0ABV4XAZ6_9CYAN
MNEANILLSDSWQDALIESLKNPEEAAAYLSAALDSEDSDPQLIKAVVQDVINAKLKINNLSEAATQYPEKLNKMLSEIRGKEIYTLVCLLNNMGFSIQIQVKETTG